VAVRTLGHRQHESLWFLQYCHRGMAQLPQGTVTFLLTDLQGSTQAWDNQPKAMRSAMARHDAILTSTVRDHAGVLVEAGREGKLSNSGLA
jgi:class 3 adenylate cyclase